MLAVSGEQGHAACIAPEVHNILMKMDGLRRTEQEDGYMLVVRTLDSTMRGLILEDKVPHIQLT